MDQKYTRKQKITNWISYHIWHLVAVAAVIVVAGSVLHNKSELDQSGYDYYFAYVGEEGIPEEDVCVLETALASLGEDVNGDGRVTVRISQFVSGTEVVTEDAVYGNAVEVAVLADITEGVSYFFLMDDPEAFQWEYQLIAHLDGSPSDEDDYEIWDKVYGWNECPALASVREQLGADSSLGVILDRLYIGRRCYVNPQLASNSPENRSFWTVLTEK